MTTPETAYRTLETRMTRIAGLEDALGMLDWDQEVMMPDGAAGARADTIATLSVLKHQAWNDPALPDLVARARDHVHDAWTAANLREIERGLIANTAVPEDLVEAVSRETNAANLAWRRARRDDDFALLAPLLEKVFRLTRETGEALGERLGLSVYDALVDRYEPGIGLERLDPLFGRLAEEIPPLVAAVTERQAREPAPVRPAGPFPVDRQKGLGEALMRALGFDFQRGRLDISAHPFSGGARDDVRITTRYDEADFTSAMMGTLHETGHALYELGLPAEWSRQPVGASRGLGLHESQSLLVEMQVSRSAPFLAFARGKIVEAFGRTGDPAFAHDNLVRLYTRVRPGFIRVDADEVTYPAHIVLRFRLEQALLSGDLAMADLSGAWNEGMTALLGITPPSDTLGCLQDIHWPGGAIGYFPTYTLGAIAAAQLYRAAREAQPGLEADIEAGRFQPLIDWLGREVHGLASLMTSDELLTRATGRSWDADDYLGHLRERYLGED
ncbi:MAG: carboxypeptidase M32 [Azospirillaceae bacterium]